MLLFAKFICQFKKARLVVHCGEVVFVDVVRLHIDIVHLHCTQHLLHYLHAHLVANKVSLPGANLDWLAVIYLAIFLLQVLTDLKQDQVCLPLKLLAIVLNSPELLVRLLELLINLLLVYRLGY